MTARPHRYHGALVALHWLLALLLIVAQLLMLAIGLHIAAALYHQFVRRDGLLAHGLRSALTKGTDP